LGEDKEGERKDEWEGEIKQNGKVGQFVKGEKEKSLFLTYFLY
jgi:hypothetical protein